MITLILVLFAIGALFLIAAWMEAREPNEDDIGKWSLEAIIGIVVLAVDVVIALGYELYRVLT